MEEEFHQASTECEATLDCARYAEGDDLEHLRVLIRETPALLNCSDDLGRTPCHMAAANGNAEALRVLVSLGAQAIPNREGNTALHYAAVNNHLECAKVLLECGRWKVGSRNVFGKTALQEIGEKQFDDMETLLMTHDEELDTYTCPPTVTMDVDDSEPNTEPSASQLNPQSNNNSEPSVMQEPLGSAVVDDIE